MITFRPSRTVVTSFHPRQRDERTSGESVATVAQQPVSSSSSTNHSTAATVLVCVALTNGAIKVYDRSTLRLVSTMQAEADVVQACFSSPAVIVAASKNGTVTAYDLRQVDQPQSSPSQGLYGGSCGPQRGILQHQITTEGTTISSMDFCSESSTIALGGANGIYLWDWRHPNHVALLGETHQNITQVRFVHRNRLVSTGDSLLCLLDCTMARERALAMMYTGKSSQYKKLGFCGGGTNGTRGTVVYCVSADNNVVLWDLAKGQCFHQTGIHQLRQKARFTTTSSFINTIVDCTYDSHHQTLSLLASNYSGDAVIFALPNLTTYQAPWQPTQRLVGGHRGVVTAWDGNNLTGGSDARVCEWMPAATASTHPTTACSHEVVAISAAAATSRSSIQPTKRQRYDAE